MDDEKKRYSMIFSYFLSLRGFFSFFIHIFNMFLGMLIIQMFIMMPLTGYRVYRSAIILASYIAPLVIGDLLKIYIKKIPVKISLMDVYLLSAFITAIIFFSHLITIFITQFIYTTVLAALDKFVQEETIVISALLFDLISTYLYITVYVPTFLISVGKVPNENIIGWRFVNMSKWREQLVTFLFGVPLASNVIMMAYADIYSYPATIEVLFIMVASSILIFCSIWLFEKFRQL